MRGLRNKKPKRRKSTHIPKHRIAIKGLSFPELIMVLMIVGILAALALPKFYNFSQQAKDAVEQQDVRCVRVGINHYYIESILRSRTPLYPEILDSAAVGEVSSDNPFFTNVLSPPAITGNEWRKLSSTSYQSQSGTVYNYNPQTGSFE